MTHHARAWIATLPASLGRHAAVIRRLLTEADKDDRIRILVVGCSIGRGVADELSDIDAYIAVTPEHWSRYVDESDGMLRRLGDLVDTSRTHVDPVAQHPSALAWALFADGIQLELAIASAPPALRPRRDWVLLYDPDRRVGELQADRFATPSDVREWGYEGWSTLLLCAKYLRRGSLWEALETLHLARTRLWRVWAAARRVPDPQYGLTAVLDSDRPEPPPGIERTHAALDRATLATAALACAELLESIWPDATATVAGHAEPLPDVAAIVRRELSEIAGSS